VDSAQSWEKVRNRTLQELEGEDRGEPTWDSHVVTELHRLRRVPLKDFRIEDLRLVIGQGDGLPFLVPMALWHLERDPLAEGDFYPGDLLKSVAGVDDAFWAPRPEMRARLVRVLEQALVRLPGVDVPGRLAGELRSYLQHHRPA
jgi:hypothetical protein